MDLQCAQDLALSLIRAHVDPLAGPVPGCVHFKWDRRVSALGSYTVKKKRVGTGPTFEPMYVYERTIRLSRTMTEVCDEVQVRDTILHEIAHARAGIPAGHGPMWVKECGVLGCRPNACGGTIGKDLPLPNTGWDAACPVCAKAYWRARRPTRRVACGACTKGVWMEDRVLNYRRRGSR